MPTNPYFYSNLHSPSEQGLIDDLIVEAIKMYGLDVEYIPRIQLNADAIIVDDRLSAFNNALPVEMSVVNVEGFTGDGDFLSKFGLQIQDRMTLAVARTSFALSITANAPTIIRPMEGDLIWFPLNHKLFEIQFVEHEKPFYQTGALQVYELTVELFEFNHESFATGNTEIDTLYQPYDLPYDDPNSPDKDARNVPIQTQANTYIDFTDKNPWGDP
jgi:ABC-type uncharacterized transport system involved in gliding motility auxiliary subunit